MAADPAFAEFDIPDLIEDINDNIFKHGRTKLTNENVAFGLMEDDSEEALALLQILVGMQEGMIDPLGGLGDSDVSDVSAPPTVDTADMEIVSATGPASDYSEMYRATGNFTVDQDLRNRVKFYERGLGSTNYEQFIDSRTGLGKSGTIWEGMTLGQILGESQRFPRMSFLYEFEEQASPYIGYGGGASPSVG